MSEVHEDRTEVFSAFIRDVLAELQRRESGVYMAEIGLMIRKKITFLKRMTLVVCYDPYREHIFVSDSDVASIVKKIADEHNLEERMHTRLDIFIKKGL